MRRSMLAISVLLGLSLAALALRPPGEAFRDITFEQAKTAASDEKKVILIDFFTTWCGPCKKLDAETWKDASVQEWLSAHCVPLKLDAEKERDLAAKYHIDAYPTILLLKPDGTQIDRFVGFKEPKEFLAAATDALAGKTSLVRAREKLARSKEKLVGHEQDPMEHQNYADELAEAGQYEEALKEYLWCFDEGKASSAYVGVRVSFLLLNIERLGERYPPAIKALEERRDAAEDRFRKGSKSNDDLLDAVCLNRSLKKPERSLAFYDEIRSAGPLDGRVRLMLFEEISEPLYRAKRFEDMLGLLDNPSKYLKEYIKRAGFRITREKEPPTDEQDARDSADSYMRTRIVEKGAHMYEAMLATKRGEEADVVANSLIELEKTGKTLATLIEAAGRQADLERARSLGERGLKELPEKDRSVVQRALDRAVKPDKAK